MPPATDAAADVVGFVAAEGTFTSNDEGSKASFTFAVALGEEDAIACEWLRDFFGCGTIHHYPRRKAHYDDEARFQVRKLEDLVERVVPFMDEHLPPSYKREQYLTWRAELLDYWEHRAKRKKPCVVLDCDRPRVGRGLCHKHYNAWHRRTLGGTCDDPDPPLLKPGGVIGYVS